MSSEFLKIDEFLLGKGFYKTIARQSQYTTWYNYSKENEKCKLEISCGDNATISLRLYSKILGTVDYCCVSECSIKWCYLEDLMELLGM